MSAVNALLLFGVAQTNSIQVTIETKGATTPISPYIYGVNGGDWVGRHKYLTFGRTGGNRMTAYNWENNASNAGSDWYHQNDDYLGGGITPGEVYRAAVDPALKAGKAYLVTIPLTDYVAADKAGGGDVAQTPNYLTKRFRQNKPRKGATFVYPPNTTDAFVYQDEFVSWLEKKFPNRAKPIFYSLDNEPDLWQYTHNRIHPQPVGYQELFNRTRDMATAIKAVAPNALIFGPVNYGFYGFVRLQDAPDNGGRDFLAWYLQQNRAHQKTTGKRLVDVLDLHWYPEAQGGGTRITGSETSASVVTARVQAPRSLWDPTYRENSWIANDWYNGPVYLLPRLKQAIAANDPQMKLAITEYNYGGGQHISGAIAQADVLGIFGRDGVFAATLWRLQSNNTFLDAAFDAFRNYDGKGGAFGDLALSTVSAKVADVTAYSSRFANGQGGVVTVVINKTTTAKPTTLWLKGQTFNTILTYSLAGTSAAVKSASLGAKKTADKVSLTLPAMSVNVVVTK